MVKLLLFLFYFALSNLECNVNVRNINLAVAAKARAGISINKRDQLVNKPVLTEYLYFCVPGEIQQVVDNRMA